MDGLSKPTFVGRLAHNMEQMRHAAIMARRMDEIAVECGGRLFFDEVIFEDPVQYEEYARRLKEELGC